MLNTHEKNGSLVTILDPRNTTYHLNLKDVGVQKKFNLALGFIDLAILVYILLVALFNMCTNNERGNAQSKSLFFL